MDGPFAAAPRELQSGIYSNWITPQNVMSLLGPRGSRTGGGSFAIFAFVLITSVLLLSIVLRTRKYGALAAASSPGPVRAATVTGAEEVVTNPFPPTPAENMRAGADKDRGGGEAAADAVVAAPPLPPRPSARPDLVALSSASPKLVAVGVIQLIAWVFGFAGTYAPWGRTTLSLIDPQTSARLTVLLVPTLFGGDYCVFPQSMTNVYMYSWQALSCRSMGTLGGMYNGYEQGQGDKAAAEAALLFAHLAMWLSFVTAVQAFCTHREVRRRLTWALKGRGFHKADCCVQADNSCCRDPLTDTAAVGPPGAMPTQTCPDGCDCGPTDCCVGGPGTRVSNVKVTTALSGSVLVLWALTLVTGIIPYSWTAGMDGVAGKAEGTQLFSLQGGFAVAVVCFIFAVITTAVAGAALEVTLNPRVVGGEWSLADVAVGGKSSTHNVPSDHAASMYANGAAAAAAAGAPPYMVGPGGVPYYPQQMMMPGGGGGAYPPPPPGYSYPQPPPGYGYPPPGYGYPPPGFPGLPPNYAPGLVMRGVGGVEGPPQPYPYPYPQEQPPRRSVADDADGAPPSGPNAGRYYAAPVQSGAAGTGAGAASSSSSSSSSDDPASFDIPRKMGGMRTGGIAGLTIAAAALPPGGWQPAAGAAAAAAASVPAPAATPFANPYAPGAQTYPYSPQPPQPRGGQR
jgi:hypothetical protein